MAEGYVAVILKWRTKGAEERGGGRLGKGTVMAVRRGARRAETGFKFGYGWVPDLPDHRDVLYGVVRKPPAKLPPAVDLRAGCSPVEDQGNLGSCTGNALAGAIEFLEKKDKVPLVDVSRLFIYYNERVIEHSVKSDSGAMIRDGIKTLVKQGVCSEKRWPYVISKFAAKPGPTCYKEALDHQVIAYARLESVDEMRACLAEGYPFVFGFTVYESFESQRVAKTGVVRMPRKGKERVLGGHAVLGVGYDDASRRMLVRNSWGTGWGMKGYFTMPYDYLADRNLSDDFWTIRCQEGF
jgi:C1A family cysteine protease